MSDSHGCCAGVAAFGLSVLAEHVYILFVTEQSTQGDFQAAARDGPMMLLTLIPMEGILPPLAEEASFRGVTANALNRYGAWAGVVGSAAFFAFTHGFSVVLLNAFIVGPLTGFFPHDSILLAWVRCICYFQWYLFFDLQLLIMI